jgi:hypothetical protein
MVKNHPKNKKPRHVRSSSIEKTIEEGRNYVSRIDRKIKAEKKTVKKQMGTTSHSVIKKIKKSKIVHHNPTTSILSLPPVVPNVPPPSAGTSLFASGPPTAGTSIFAPVQTGPTNQMIEQELQYRLFRESGNISKLNFSLRWWDPNDLDLHVTCPCGTEIFYANRRCGTCLGELDIDMNAGGNNSL